MRGGMTLTMTTQVRERLTNNKKHGEEARIGSRDSVCGRIAAFTVLVKTSTYVT